MNKAQIKAKKRRKQERDRKKKYGLFGSYHRVPTLDEYFAKGGGGPWRR